MPVVIVAGKRTLPSMTEDISLRGLFVHTDSPPSLRQLVRVDLNLPGAGKLSLTAMVVFVLPVRNEHQRPPGVGLQLYGVGREAEGTWHAFVREVASRSTAADRLEVEAEPLSALDPVRRRYPRTAVRLRVRPRNLDALAEMWTRDVSRGGMFLETDQELSVGDILELDVVHPNRTETFALTCTVRRVARGSAGRGVGVEILDLDADRRAAFQQFATSDLPTLDDEVTLVSEDDPALA